MGRRRHGGHDCVDRALSFVRNNQRLLFQSCTIEAFRECALMRGAIDVEADCAIVFLQAACGKQHPCLILCAEITRLFTLGLDQCDERRQHFRRRLGFRSKRKHCSTVTQRRTVIGAIIVETGLAGCKLERRIEDAFGTLLIAIKGECCAKLCDCHGAREVFKLGIGIITQIADGCLLVARQNVKRIGNVVTAFFHVGCITESVLQIGERREHCLLRHVIALFTSTREEVGHIGVHPEIPRTWRPQAERTA